MRFLVEIYLALAGSAYALSRFTPANETDIDLRPTRPWPAFEPAPIPSNASPRPRFPDLVQIDHEAGAPLVYHQQGMLNGFILGSDLEGSVTPLLQNYSLEDAAQACAQLAYDGSEEQEHFVAFNIVQRQDRFDCILYEHVNRLPVVSAMDVNVRLTAFYMLEGVTRQSCNIM